MKKKIERQLDEKTLHKLDAIDAIDNMLIELRGIGCIYSDTLAGFAVLFNATWLHEEDSEVISRLVEDFLIIVKALHEYVAFRDR